MGNENKIDTRLVRDNYIHQEELDRSLQSLYPFVLLNDEVIEK